MKSEQNLKHFSGLIVLGISLLFFASSALADTKSIDFTSISSDARQISLGGELAADPAGARAVIANPAGLALPSRPEIKSSAVSLYGGQALNYNFSYFQPLGQGEGLGFSLPYQSVEAIPQTDFDASGNPQIIGYLSDTKLAAILAYGRAVTPEISLGIAAKYYTHRLGEKSGTSLAADFGVLYTPAPAVTFGLTARDLISSPFSWSDGQQEKLAGQIAAQFVCRFDLAGNPVSIMAGANYVQSRTLRENIGLEYVFSQNFALRAGADLCQGGFYPALGLGLSFGSFDFDYSYKLMDEAAGSIQIVTVGWRFN